MHAAVRPAYWVAVFLAAAAAGGSPGRHAAQDTSTSSRPNVVNIYADDLVLRRLDAVVTREHRRVHIREWEFVDSRVPPGTQP